MKREQQLSLLLAGLVLGAVYLNGNRATRTARAGLNTYPEAAQPGAAPVPIYTPPPKVPTPKPSPTPAPTPSTGPKPLQVATPRSEPKADSNRDHLHPEYRKRLESFLAAAKKKSFRVLVYETYRSAERQSWLWSYGRSAPNASRAKVTWTLDSLHRYGLAADLVCLLPSGAADWSHAAYDRLYAACPPKSFGLELIIGEMPHVQLAGGYTYAAANGIQRDWRTA